MLPNIKALFFDIDNTLIDFHKSAYSAMCDAMAELCLEAESEALFAHFLAVNDILWKDVVSTVSGASACSANICFSPPQRWRARRIC